ncbi:MAG: prolyl oligopeptidase family serine peptidase [Bacteroidales bacterium]
MNSAHLKGNIYALNKLNGDFRMVFNNSENPYRNFNLVKNHFIISCHGSTQTIAYLFNNKTFKSRKIEIKEKGHCNFINNKQDTTILFTLESIKYPKSLYLTSIKYPNKNKQISHLDELDAIRYNPDEIQVEEHSIITRDGRPVNFTLSYKGKLKKDGKNPLMISVSPINSGVTNSFFYFSRILYLEKGFILIERSPYDLDLKPTLEHKMIDLEDAIAYLIEKRYTSNNKIVINTRNYGATVVASVLNKKPDICRAVFFTNGIFDMVRHEYLDPNNPYQINHFKYKNEQEFKRIYNLSAYHHIRYKGDYPSIFLGFDGYQNNNPAHTFKYAAKLQMRTKAKNPIIIYNPLPDSCDSTSKTKDLKQYIYLKSLFIFDQLGIN